MKEEIEKNNETIENEEPTVEKDSVEEQSSAEETIQQLGEKLEEIDDKYKRLYAEYENYRKRTRLEIADIRLNGGQETIKSVLPVLDDMERALAMNDDEGFRLIYNKLVKTLQQKGLKEMQAKGERFDESVHEAVAQVPAAEEAQKGVVMDVVEKGYFLNEKVLRFAKVVVAC